MTLAKLARQGRPNEAARNEIFLLGEVGGGLGAIVVVDVAVVIVALLRSIVLFGAALPRSVVECGLSADIETG